MAATLHLCRLVHYFELLLRNYIQLQVHSWVGTQVLHRVMIIYVEHCESFGHDKHAL